jgi:hypothetical protein
VRTSDCVRSWNSLEFWSVAYQYGGIPGLWRHNPGGSSLQFQGVSERAAPGGCMDAVVLLCELREGDYLGGKDLKYIECLGTIGIKYNRWNVPVLRVRSHGG